MPSSLTILIYCLVVSSTLDWLPVYSSGGFALKLSHVLFFWGAAYLLLAKRGYVKFDFIVACVAISYSLKLLAYFVSLIWSQDIQFGLSNLLRDFFYLSNFVVFYLIFSEVRPQNLYPIIIRGGVFSILVFFIVTIFTHRFNGSDPFGVAVAALGRGDFLAFKRDYFYKVLVFLGNSGDEGYLTGKITHSIGTAFLFLAFVGYIYRFFVLRDDSAPLRFLSVVLVLFGVFSALWSYSSRVQLSLLIFIFSLAFTAPRKRWLLYSMLLSSAVFLLIIGNREFVFGFVGDLLDNPRARDFSFILGQIQSGFPLGHGIGTPMRDVALPYGYPHNIFLADMYVVGFFGIITSVLFICSLLALSLFYFRVILRKGKESVGYGVIGLYSVLVLLFLSQITSLGQFDTAIWLLSALGLSLSRRELFGQKVC